jgi:uncharacterized protein YukE
MPMGWPDRVGGARLGRSLSPADRALAQRAAQNRAAHTALFLLLAAVVAVIGMALTRRDGAAKGAPAEKTLIAEESSSNLNATSAAAPARPTEPEPAKEPEMTPHWSSGHAEGQQLPPVPLSAELATMEAQAAQPASTVPPPLPAPTELVPFPEAVPVVDVPAPAVNPVPAIVTQPVESTMISTWKSLGYPAVLLAAFAASPSVAAPEDTGKDDKTPATAKDIRDIKDILRTMDQAVGKDVQQMKKDIGDLRKEVDALKSGNGSAGSMTSKEIDDLKQQILKLQQTIDAVSKRLPQTATAMRPSNPTGKVQLVNDYPYQVDFVVNDLAYPIAPGMTRIVNLPTGATFTFRIPSITGYQANRTRSLDGDQPYVIRVFPMQ